MGDALPGVAAPCVISRNSASSRSGPVFGHWTVVAIPIARDEIPLGAISLGRPGLGAVLGQSDREMQARTEALAQRNSEYGERIEHQSAIIDVLKAL